jgi:hypothetical protein
VRIRIKSEHVHAKYFRNRTEHKSNTSSSEFLYTEHLGLELSEVCLLVRMSYVVAIETVRACVLFLSQERHLNEFESLRYY